MMMCKLRILGFAFIALIAFGAINAAAALAAPEWLDNGELIGVKLPVLSELMTDLLLEDTGNASELECSVGENVGTVGIDGEDETLTTECLTGEMVTGPCELTPKDTLIFALELPWESTLELEEPGGVNMYYDLVQNKATGKIGYEVVCLVLGTEQKDKCVGPGVRFLVENAAEGTVLLETDALTEADSLLGLCSGVLGAGAPLVLTGSDTLIIAEETGLALSVSG